MRRLFTHVVIYVAAMALITAVWVLLFGSLDDLQQLQTNPTEAVSLGFWPVWPILGWGFLVVVHAAIVLPGALTGGKTRREKARQRRRKIAKQVGHAIEDAHERRQRRDPRPGRQPAAPELKWVTVMFCDVAGSTVHNERLGNEEWHRVLAHVRGVARAALMQRGGTEVGTQGDGMLARFNSPADAVLCGVDIQSELGSAREESGFVPEVRIGIHAGEAVEDDGDLIGHVINLASRVTDEATPGEILVTEPVADQLVGKLTLEDKGLRPLKGIQQPRHLLAVRWGDVTDS